MEYNTTKRTSQKKAKMNEDEQMTNQEDDANTPGLKKRHNK